MRNIVIDISKLNPLAIKRGVGIYAKNLALSLQRLKDGNKYFLKQNKEYLGIKKIDLIHYPYFDPFFLTLPWFERKPMVVTVHDLIPLVFPKKYAPGVRGKIKWQIQKFLIKKAKSIITDSKNSKKDIVNIIGFPEQRVFPIYLASNESFKQSTISNLPCRQAGQQSAMMKKKYSLPEYFLLYVGDLNWNKNIKGLIKAFRNIKNNPPSANGRSGEKLKLILVGSAFSNSKLVEFKELKKLIENLELEKDIKLLGFLPNQELAVLYNLATLYIQPSFYEGFGLPVLEAMSCGCPVLSSNQSSLPEVGGDAVAYFNPYTKGDLETKIKRLICHKDKLAKFQELGLKQARKFSWEKTALETKKVYEKVLS